MEELKTYRLADICNSIQTGPFGSQLHKSDYVEFGTPIVMPKDITNGKINDNNISRISKNDVARLFKHKLVPGNIIYPRRGDISKCALITSKEDGWVCGTGCIKVDINQQIANSTYVMYVLCQSETVNWIESNAVGTTMLNLNTSILSDLPIKLPSLNTQKKLANIVSSFDKKIALNRRINDNLEQQAQALFKSWFVDFEPFKDGKFVESEMGMIPEGWKVLNFNSFITPLNDKVHAGSLPEYSVTNNGIIPRSKKFSKQLSSSTSKNKIVKFNNIVFGMSREILNWGIMQDQIGSVSSAYHVYAINESIIPPLYLKFLMESMPAYFNDLIGTASREGQSLDKGALMNKLVYIPCIEIWKSFVDFSTSIRNKQSKNSNEMIQLVDLRDTLLPKLMSGELKINNLNC